MRRFRWPSVALVAISLVTVLASDLFIRARGLDGEFGINARSYDIVSTIMLMIGLWGFWLSLRAEQKASDPIVTKTIRMSWSHGAPALSQTAVEESLDNLNLIVATYLDQILMSVDHFEQGYKVYLTGPTSKVDHILNSQLAWLLVEKGQPIRMEVLP